MERLKHSNTPSTLIGIWLSLPIGSTTVLIDRLCGFSTKNLRHMLRFAEAFPEREIVSAVQRQLSWTHIKTLIYIDDPLKRDFYIDLLLYNRRLKRLVAIELKLGEFKAEYKGQMELYLRWLTKHEQEAGEAPPLGVILCSGSRNKLNCWNWMPAVSTWLNTSPACPPRARLENRGEEA